MPVCADPAAVLEQQVPMYHLDDDHRYIMIMGVGPEGSDGNYQSFAPFQIPIEYDYDVLDLKHIIQVSGLVEAGLQVCTCWCDRTRPSLAAITRTAPCPVGMNRRRSVSTMASTLLASRIQL